METTNIEQTILKLEKSYWQAMKDNDSDTILSLTDDPCIVTGPQGIMKFNKKDFMTMMNSPQNYKLRDFQFKNGHQISVLDDKTAVIAYQVKESIEVDGRRIYLDLSESSTWRFINDKWVCSLHTEAIAGDPFGRDKNTN